MFRRAARRKPQASQIYFYLDPDPSAASMLQGGPSLKCAWFVALSVVCSSTVTCLDSCETQSLPRKPACQYGTLPGRWIQGDLGAGWNVYEPTCQLQNLLGGPSLPVRQIGAPGSEAGILLFGDSVDRFIIRDVCQSLELQDLEDIWSMGVESFCLCRCAAGHV